MLIDHLDQMHTQLGVPNRLREIKFAGEYVGKPLCAVVDEDVDDCGWKHVSWDEWCGGVER